MGYYLDKTGFVIATKADTAYGGVNVPDKETVSIRPGLWYVLPGESFTVDVHAECGIFRVTTVNDHMFPFWVPDSSVLCTSAGLLIYGGMDGYFGFNRAVYSGTPGRSSTLQLGANRVSR